MKNNTLFNQINTVKKNNPKIARAFDIFERTQKIFDRTLSVITPSRRSSRIGTYSSAVSKKDYDANISTTTQ